MMVQRLSQGQVLIPEALSASVFPEIDQMLAEKEYQRALRFVAGRKNMEGYHSMVDFLFCELFRKFRAPCRRFYEGKGPALRNLPEATPDQIRRWGVFMKGALIVAHVAYEQQLRMNWSGFQNQLLELAESPIIPEV